MKTKLTPGQQNAYETIIALLIDNHSMPTHRMLGNELGISEQSARNYYQALVEKGYVEKVGPNHKLIDKRLKVVRG